MKQSPPVGAAENVSAAIRHTIDLYFSKFYK